MPGSEADKVVILDDQWEEIEVTDEEPDDPNAWRNLEVGDKVDIFDY